MADIQRMRATWDGFIGAPGLSTFYFVDAAAAQSAVRDFFTAVQSELPADVSVTVEGSGDTLDVATGTVTGVWSGTVPIPVSGTASGGYAAPAGQVVRWLTGSFGSHGQITGRTFLVPTTSAAMAADGKVGAASTALVQAAADALVAAAADNYGVWSRPRPGHAGTFRNITSASVSRNVAILRTRRQ